MEQVHSGIYELSHFSIILLDPPIHYKIRAIDLPVHNKLQLSQSNLIPFKNLPLI